MQILLRQWLVRRQATLERDRWPVGASAGNSPPAWPGWPGGKRFAFVLTHDVDLAFGASQCLQLADLETERGFRPSFGIVPLRYPVPERLRQQLTERGCEIMLHGVTHDGKLFSRRQFFEKRAVQIHYFLKKWGISGFCTPSAHHHISWHHKLNIDYCISTYDFDPFEPQSCGLGRIFPFWVRGPDGAGGHVELPYTLAQDFTLFILMGQKNDGLWRRKLDWIAERGGMALIKTHPDYMAFDRQHEQFDRYPIRYYTDFLEYFQSSYGDQAWIASPSEVARYWRELSVPPEISEIPIEPCEYYCSSCKQAHAAGLMTNYRPRLSVTMDVDEAANQITIR